MLFRSNPDFPSGDKCLVCMAGAVMACSLGASPNEDLVPENYSSAIADKLEALNAVRAGNINIALRRLKGSDFCPSDVQEGVIDEAGGEILDALHTSTIARLAPAKTYLKVADALEKVGL